MIRCFFLSIILLSSFLPKSVYSQTGMDIERATRETDRLDREQIEERLRKIPEKPVEIRPEETLPEEKEEEKFFIRRIDLVGCENFSPESFSFITKRYENKELSLFDLEILAKGIEREYLKRGAIAAVFVPPQEIEEEIVILQVVEARMGQLEIQKHKYFDRKRLNYYWQILPGEFLRYDKISKSIQMMNKNPDREVKATLHAGKEPGTTDILLTPKTNFPLHFVFSLDREGSPPTGVVKKGGGIRHNNFLSLDDILLSGYTWGKDFSGIYIYHNLPVSAYGTSLLYGYSRSESKPKKEYAIHEIRSEAKNISLSLHQDLYKKDEYLGEVHIEFNAKDKTTQTKEGTLNRDRLRIISLGASFLHRGLGSSTSISPEFSQGIKALGASPDDNPLASRGAKPSFSKFKLSLHHRRNLPLNLKTSLKFKTQISSRKLTPQEEFSLGGIDSVRGYPSGDYLADTGITENLELLIPAFFIPARLQLPYDGDSLKNQTTMVVFLDHGWGKRRGALATEKQSVNLLGIGAGLRLSFFNQLLLRLEWGFPLGGNRSLTESGRSRFHFSVDFQEKLPGEIERIKQIIEEENIKRWAWQLVNEELSRPESPIRQKLYDYLYLAQICYQQGRLKESKELYERIARISKSLYSQAEEYVKEGISKQKELQECYKLALKYHKERKFTEAKNLWQKIIEEAKPKILILEY